MFYNSLSLIWVSHTCLIINNKRFRNSYIWTCFLLTIIPPLNSSLVFIYCKFSSAELICLAFLAIIFKLWAFFCWWDFIACISGSTWVRTQTWMQEGGLLRFLVLALWYENLSNSIYSVGLRKCTLRTKHVYVITTYERVVIIIWWCHWEQTFMTAILDYECIIIVHNVLLG